MRDRAIVAALVVALMSGETSALAQTCKPRLAETDVAGVRLGDEKSADRVFGDTNALQSIQDKDAQGVDADFPYVRFLSADGRQEARFYIHNGDIVGSYNEIEVMPATPAAAGARRLLPALASERGVALGMAQADLVRLLGPCHKTERRAGGVTRLSYRIDDPNHAVLRRTKMPAYLAEYDFRDGRLARFRIGLEYP